MQQHDAIPSELRDLMQWVCWRYEEKDGKETKVLYSPMTGFRASSTDRTSWVTFNMAVEAADANIGYTGIGFVLSKDDPYCFIDLDNADGADNAAEVYGRQRRIFEAFEGTYAEISPSGKGLHIICKASVPTGRKRMLCEIYSDGRYMTMTGNVYRNAPIIDHHNLANILWSELGAAAVISYYDGSAAPTATDQEVIGQAAKAANARKFVDLYQGKWQADYPSQSEADLALINIIAYYSNSREQIKRIFRASALGKREKAQSDKWRVGRNSYTDHMITRSFDMKLPEINIDALKERMNAHMAAQSNPIPNGNGYHYEALASVPETDREPILPAALETYALTPPPGLMGDIARFIYRRAPRPVPEVAIVGAIGLMSGVCGRAYNISGTGLNNYIMLVAKTAVGKEAIATGIDALFDSVRPLVPAVDEFKGPSEIASPEALLRYMADESKSFVSIFSEMGQRLLRMSSPSANNSTIGLKTVWLDLYNKSGKNRVLGKHVYADSRKNSQPIRNPAFSMIGESVPGRFYEALSEDAVEEGLVPRFTVIEYHGDRPDPVEGVEKVTPDESLRQRFAQLCLYVLRLNQSDEVIDVQYTPEAEAYMRDFGKQTDDRIRATEDVTRELYNRAHMKAMRMAALVAVGNDPIHPVIDMESATWAVKLVINDVRNMSDRFDRGEIGNVATSETAQMQKVRTVLVNYFVTPSSEMHARYLVDPAMHASAVVPYTYIQRRLLSLPAFRNDRLGATMALRRVLQSLIDNGEIVEVSKQQMLEQFASSAKAYGVVNFSHMQRLDMTRRAPVH